MFKKLCVLCSKVLGSGSMKLEIWKTHFTSLLPTHVLYKNVAECENFTKCFVISWNQMRWCLYITQTFGGSPAVSFLSSPLLKSTIFCGNVNPSQVCTSAKTNLLVRWLTWQVIFQVYISYMCKRGELVLALLTYMIKFRAFYEN